MSARRFFFVHVQKTAGSSLIARLRNHFADRAVYPHPDDGDIVDCVISVDHLRERWRARGHEVELLTGHFPLCTADALGEPFTAFTVLRHPLDRTLSYLSHHRRSSGAGDVSLEEIYDDRFRFEGLVHNHMVKMFSLDVDEMSAGALTQVEFTPERLERAKENLAGVEVVGLQERFDEFCHELTARFGFDLGDPVRANQTRPRDAERPPALCERILEDNALDVELYDFAVELVDRRRADAGLAGRPGAPLG